MQIKFSHSDHLDTGIVALVGFLIPFVLLINVLLSITTCADVDKRKIASRDWAFVLFHGISVMFCAGVLIQNWGLYKYSEDALCKGVVFWESIIYVLLRVGVLNIYYVRLSTLIRKGIFTKWIRYLCWVAMLSGISVVIPIATSQLHGEIDEEGTCYYIVKPNAFKISAVAQVTPVLLFMVLYTVPCFKPQLSSSYSWSLTWRTYLGVGIFCTVIDISTILFVNFLPLDSLQRISVLVPSIVLNNVILVFIFSDWRTRVIPCMNRRSDRYVVRLDSSLRPGMEGQDFQEAFYPTTEDVFGSFKGVRKASARASHQQSWLEEQDLMIESTR